MYIACTYMCIGINNDILKSIERMRMPDPSLVIKRLRWKEEITVEEGKKLLERTLYPFKEVYTCILTCIYVYGLYKQFKYLVLLY